MLVLFLLHLAPKSLHCLEIHCYAQPPDLPYWWNPGRSQYQMNFLRVYLWIVSLPCLSACVTCIATDLPDWCLGEVREIEVGFQRRKQPKRSICRAGVVEASPRPPAPPRRPRRSQATSAGGAQRLALVEQRESFLAKKAVSTHLRSWPRHKYLPLLAWGKGVVFRPLPAGERQAVRSALRAAGTAQPVARDPCRASSLR